MHPTSLLTPLTLHVVGFVIWVGTLLTLARLLVLRLAEADAGARQALGRAARKLGMVADVGATLALLGGVWMLVVFPGYLKMPWMHIKLTLVVLVLGVHGFVRAKAKRAALSAEAGFPAPVLAALGLLVVGIVSLAIYKRPM